MSELIAYYDDEPVALKGQVELHQAPLASAKALTSIHGPIRAGLVYVRVASSAGVVHVPFGEYDEWSLRDRYNEVIRIMNTLGASEITIETYREVKLRRSVRARLLKQGGELTHERVQNSGFDYRHTGSGSEPRDPSPLRWPDEPGFAAAVSSVLHNGATSVSITIKSERRHSTQGEFALDIKRFGLDLGGQSEQAGATSLEVRAVFPKPKRGWK